MSVSSIPAQPRQDGSFCLGGRWLACPEQGDPSSALSLTIQNMASEKIQTLRVRADSFSDLFHIPAPSIANIDVQAFAQKTLLMERVLCNLRSLLENSPYSSSAPKFLSHEKIPSIAAAISLKQSLPPACYDSKDFGFSFAVDGKAVFLDLIPASRAAWAEQALEFSCALLPDSPPLIVSKGTVKKNVLEMEIVKALQGKEGIFPVYGIFMEKDTAIAYSRCPAFTFASQKQVLQKLSDSEKFRLMTEMLSGLSSIAELGSHNTISECHVIVCPSETMGWRAGIGYFGAFSPDPLNRSKDVADLGNLFRQLWSSSSPIPTEVNPLIHLMTTKSISAELALQDLYSTIAFHGIPQIREPEDETL